MANAGALIGAKKPSVVTLERATERAPVLVEDEKWLATGLGKEIFGGKGAIPYEFECRAMDLIRATARDDADDAAGRTSVLRGVVTRLDLELLNGFELWAHRITLMVIDATDVRLIEAAVKQVHVLHATVAERREGLIFAIRRHGACRQHRELQIIAAVQRKLLEGLAIDDLTLSVAGRVDQRRFASNDYGLGHCTDVEFYL